MKTEEDSVTRVGATSAILGELCVAPYMGARGFPVDLTDSRLPSRTHEKFIEPSIRQTCKKATFAAKYVVFRGIHPKSHQPLLHIIVVPNAGLRDGLEAATL